jgi:hypothetical protein
VTSAESQGRSEEVQVTVEPQPPQTAASETAEAVAAQIQEVRDVLRTDAAAAGIDIERVDTVVDTAFAAYADARVHGFLGVLVDRDVRSALRLRQSGDIDTDTDTAS